MTLESLAWRLAASIEQGGKGCGGGVPLQQAKGVN